MQETIGELAALEVPDLPDIEDRRWSPRAAGSASAHTLLVAYNRLLESIDRIWQYHFEFLNLGYAAYLVFYELCKQSFPDIPDQTIAKMVSGIDVVLFRPDDELEAASPAARWSSASPTSIKTADDRGRAARGAVGQRCRVSEWLADWEAVKTPWFYYSNGNGFYHHHRSWIDDPAVPLAYLRTYIERLRGRRGPRPPAGGGQRRARPDQRRVPRAARRDDDGAAFDQNLGLARTVFPYVESHNFYVEHWYHTLFWNKVREFGALLARHGFLDDTEDVFYLQRTRDLRRARRPAARVGGRVGRPRTAVTGRRSSQSASGSWRRCGGSRRRRRSAPYPTRSPSR